MIAGAWRCGFWFWNDTSEVVLVRLDLFNKLSALLGVLAVNKGGA